MAAGAVGFGLGYCAQIFHEGCAKNVGGGVKGALALRTYPVEPRGRAVQPASVYRSRSPPN